VRARPEGVRPGVAKARPPRRTAATEEVVVRGDGAVCRQCRLANAAGRSFCRRCGAWLLEEPVVVVEEHPPLPWWRRAWNWVVGRWTRRPARFRAGERPAVRRRHSTSDLRRKVNRVLMAVVLVVALVPGLRRPVVNAIGGTFHAAKDVVTPTYLPVHPVAVTATSSAPDHGPELAADEASNTHWAEGAEGDGEGQALTFEFDEPLDLARIIVTVGASTNEDAFLTQPRPRVLHVVFDSGGTDDIVLADVPTPQQFKLKAKKVTSIEFGITLVHRSQTGADASITEIEFFTVT
ncbi:MAG: NADase-type glycan-binding domain-containing protein, partial [Acidimicrobiia bacterium]